MNEKSKGRAHRIKFGRKIALERAYRGLTTEQVARLTGIPVAMITTIEEGRQDFPLAYMLLLLDILDVDTKEFFSDFN